MLMGSGGLFLTGIFSVCYVGIEKHLEISNINNVQTFAVWWLAEIANGQDVGIRKFALSDKILLAFIRIDQRIFP